MLPTIPCTGSSAQSVIPLGAVFLIVELCIYLCVSHNGLSKLYQGRALCVPRHPMLRALNTKGAETASIYRVIITPLARLPQQPPAIDSPPRKPTVCFKITFPNLWHPGSSAPSLGLKSPHPLPSFSRACSLFICPPIQANYAWLASHCCFLCLKSSGFALPIASPHKYTWQKKKITK